MNSKFLSVPLKVKTALLKTISISLALFLAILPISFSVSAVSVNDETSSVVTSLPFPSPESFGENSKSIVLYNSAKNRFTYFVLTYDMSPVANSCSVDFDVTLNSGNNDNNATFNYVKFRVRPVIPYSATQSTSNDIINVAKCRLYQFNWVVGTSNYSVAERTLDGEHSSYVAYKRSLQSPNPYYILTYNYGSNTSPYEWSTKYTQTFNGTNVNVRVASNISYSFASSDSGAILSVLNDMSGTVRFYLGQILSKLTDDEGFTPEQTTINSDMSDYDSAEGALMDNNIQALNDMALPDIDNFNSGKQGNAFKFISSNIEFFSGMNGSGSIAKVGTVLMIILALGLTSFVIGLSNRKKGG